VARYSRSKFAILGLLTLGPCSGYDIKKYTEEILSHFWRESYGNLYKLLGRLAAEGLVRRRIERQRGRPDRIEYSITEAGRQAFHAWLEQPAEHEVLRSELLLKLFFGDQIPRARVVEHLQAYRSRQQETLETLRQADRGLDEVEAASNTPYLRMTLRRGLLMGEARLAWAEECLEELSGTVKEGA
jgi:DNA-binding PadR family transcriptional regulator